MSKNKKKFYAVAVGQTPGIYEKWYGEDGAEAQVRGFPGARYRGFPSKEEAGAWLEECNRTGPQQQTLFREPEPVQPRKPRKPRKPENRIPLEKTGEKQELNKDRVIIYTDGGCLNNPGPGGYGAVLTAGGKKTELSGGYRRTTNNRMELTACIAGLKALEHPSPVTLYSDSQYVVNGIKKGWAKRWRKNGWMRNDIEPAENADLWGQLLDLCTVHRVGFCWVKGHAGLPGNERCDRLAKQAAADEDNHSRDIAYETGKTTVITQ